MVRFSGAVLLEVVAGELKVGMLGTVLTGIEEVVDCVSELDALVVVVDVVDVGD